MKAIDVCAAVVLHSEAARGKQSRIMSVYAFIDRQSPEYDKLTASG